MKRPFGNRRRLFNDIASRDSVSLESASSSEGPKKTPEEKDAELREYMEKMKALRAEQNAKQKEAQKQTDFQIYH